MITIRLVDARRGLNLKCRELFRDEKIADAIYGYLCDGIEECEDAEPERKTGKWICSDDLYETAVCLCCGWDTTEPWQHIKSWFKFCPHCGADMRGEQDG